jgi:hypothetical protein
MIKLKIKAPKGMSGLACKPWGGEIVGVAANWAEASSSVLVWSDEDEGWIGDSQGRQVADFQHCPHTALETIIEEIAQDGGDEVSEDEMDEILENVVEI